MASFKKHYAVDSDTSDSEMSDAPTPHKAGNGPKYSSKATFEKDSEEEELERLVLGDDNAFRNSLFGGANVYDATVDVSGKELMQLDEDDEMEGMADAELFMFDTGASGDASKAQKPEKNTTPGELPAWQDSDDDRVTVKLMKRHGKVRQIREVNDDELVHGKEYIRRLRDYYLRLNPRPAWSKQSDERPTKRSKKTADGDTSDSSDLDSDAELSSLPMNQFLRDINKLAGRNANASRPLQPGAIDIQKTRDIPDRHLREVTSLSFHPKYPVLLSASPASKMWLHHIAPEANPQPNPALTSVQAKRVDVRRAQFLYPDGDQIFFAGRRKYFHHWDLPSGTVQKTAGIQGRKEDHKSMERFRLSPCGSYMAIQGSSKKGGGIVSIISAASTQWVAEARLSAKGGVRDFQWWRNGEGMTILGQDGMVGEYSLADRRFLATWMDEGGVNSLVLALGGRGGPDAFGEDAWVAIGSNSGMCTLYNRSFLLEDPVKERPEPTRTFENIITPVTVITFSPDGQLLAYGSLEKDTLKLVHVASQTVYRNWPTAQTPLGRVTAVAFGKDSDMLAVGNDRGKIRLWEIRR
ncbi:hypothetical protein NLU13_3840 [Sarocladium strictum]|uniref:U3 small nucleolar RNA-associated protein 18 n=1 Tax=Sarocladium strictum TaxID=5046 RepID=A0AA39GJG2_SARSR|nr:hypothetical protein NLU13_3840 [Sarocladium strictum]